MPTNDYYVDNYADSPIIQALLIAKKAGFPSQKIDELLEFANNNKRKLHRADQIFNELQYLIDDSTTFFRGNRDVQITCFLSANELKILYLMIQNMGPNNLIALSLSDIKNYAGIADKTATKALNGLKEKGCIAVQFNRNKTRGRVYMVNPNIALVGNINKDNLEKTFWRLTGSKFKDD